MTIKVTGNNKSSESIEFGTKILSGLCAGNGDRYLLNEKATLSVDSEIFTTDMKGTCKVKTKSVIKNGESFNLNTININAKANYLD